MFIYKYQSISDNTIKLLIDKKLWKAYPTSFNDPFELRLMHLDATTWSEAIGLSKIRQQIPDLDHLSDPDFLIHLINEYQEYFYSFRVISFSEVYDDIVMWSHYADHHKGICLGFEVEDTTSALIYPVNYGDDYPKINFENILDDEGIFKILINKSTHWRYEKEWRRIFAHLPGYPNPHPGDFAEYPGKLTEVILGARISDENEKLVRRILSEETLVIKNASLHPQKYELVIK